ncbi:MAG: hypothetical protein ACREJC_16345 [Tepidisphaeraceae bacterium]
MQRLLVGLIVLTCSLSLAGPGTSARRALDTVLPEVNLTGVALSDALDFLRDVSGANLHVEWKALEALGVGRDTPVNVRLRSVSLRKVLNIILAESGAGAPLAYYVDGGVIEVTTKELADKDMITRVYPVEDLIMEVPDFVGPSLNLASAGGGGGGSGGGGGGSGLFGGGGGGGGNDDQMSRAERAEQLIETIKSIIQPDIWADNGGTAQIRFFNGSLIVTAPRSVHEALAGPVD